MQKRKLGNPVLSLVGLGVNNFCRRTDVAASRLVVHRALDLASP